MVGTGGMVGAGGRAGVGSRTTDEGTSAVRLAARQSAHLLHQQHVLKIPHAKVLCIVGNPKLVIRQRAQD